MKFAKIFFLNYKIAKILQIMKRKFKSKWLKNCCCTEFLNENFQKEIILKDEDNGKSTKNLLEKAFQKEEKKTYIHVYVR